MAHLVTKVVLYLKYTIPSITGTLINPDAAIFFKNRRKLYRSIAYTKVTKVPNILILSFTSILFVKKKCMLVFIYLFIYLFIIFLSLFIYLFIFFFFGGGGSCISFLFDIVLLTKTKQTTLTFSAMGRSSHLGPKMHKTAFIPTPVIPIDHNPTSTPDYNSTPNKSLP